MAEEEKTWLIVFITKPSLQLLSPVGKKKSSESEEEITENNHNGKLESPVSGNSNFQKRNALSIKLIYERELGKLSLSMLELELELEVWHHAERSLSPQ